MKTVYQAAIMALLKDFNCLRRGQVEKYMQINWGSSAVQVGHMLRQLRYLGEIMITGDLAMLPERREKPEVTAAFDVMLELTAGTKINISPGAPPYIMFFTVESRKNSSFYGVVYVGRNKEFDMAARLRKIRGPELTPIIILETLEQQQYFNALENIYFAIHDGSKYRYFNGGE